MLFLTGLPRTGTTWAGQVLAAALAGAYVNEPFNWKFHPDREPWHMAYLRGDQADDGFDEIASATAGPRSVVKDVHSCLAVERWAVWHPTVVLQVRHPCAVAASWAALDYRADWQADLLLAQDTLMTDHLEAGRAELEQRGDLFHDVGAYWGATYRVLADLAAGHPAWRWAVHERLCVDPDVEFRLLLDGLDFDTEALANVLRDTDRSPTADESPYAVARRTGDEPEKWRGQLTADQIDTVMGAVEPFAVFDRWFTR